MAKAKTPKQLDIKIKSLKKQVTKFEAQKKRAVVAVKKKPVKKKAVKRKVVRRKVKKKSARRKRR